MVKVNLKVVKRDGKLEKFDRDKLFRIAVSTGLNEKQATKLADNITKWALNKKEDKVTTSEIRKKFVTELKKVRKYSADKYIWYQTVKDKHYPPLH